MTDKRYSEISRMKCCDALCSSLLKVISEAVWDGYSYEEIYTALHKTVDLSMYEWEVENAL